MRRKRIYISGLTCLTCAILVLISGCGSSPGDQPILPPPVIWTGNITISAEFETDDGIVTPDSLNVTLDGINLGWYSNPDTLTDIPEGSHNIKASCIVDGETYFSPALTVYVVYDEYADVSANLTKTGAVYLTVQGAIIPDSTGLKVNGDTLGYGVFPAYLEIPAGTHKFVAFADIDTTHLEDWLAGVEVVAAETTEVTMNLVPVSPLAGVHAPDTDVTDINGNSYSLSDHWGEVIYLYFFSHT